MSIDRCRESFFFEPSSDDTAPVYGALCHPLAAPQKTAVVMVTPIGRERLHIYREVVLLARNLAGHGFPTIRFDYRGEGESGGVMADTTIETRLADIHWAIQTVIRRTGCARICLLALHTGALLAAAAAVRFDVEQVILCDPVCDPQAYVRTLLRSSILLLNYYQGSSGRRMADVWRDLEADRQISVHGVQFGHPLLAALQAFDPEALLNTYRGEALLLHFNRRDTKCPPDLRRWQNLISENGTAQTDRIGIDLSWNQRRFWSMDLTPLFDRVARFLGAGER